ncbi:MAG: 30S ribosomal protein S13 [Candidatus Aenigmarchaeota archaeon]|nr:30S ribosomal protein S13 [Candidatus Aenigmarchaeota archaeon]
MSELRKIVRFMDTDIDGTLKTGKALRRIKGVGFTFSRISCMKAGISEDRKIGELSADELKTLQNAIASPAVPAFLLNRRKDMETGNDVHLTKIALDFAKREDINLLKRIKSYKGLRHELGQPVRGQRTRSSFRTNTSVGVSKKAVKEKSAPKKAEAAAPAPAKK